MGNGAQDLDGRGVKALKQAVTVLIHVLVLRPISKLFFGATISGRENLRDLDQFVLIANHNSHLDTLLLFCALPSGRIATTRPVAAADHFRKNRLLFAVVDYLFSPVWIDRSRRDGSALASILCALDAGFSLILFPEGTRGDPGRLAPFHSGIGRVLEARSRIPAVPAFLEGTERAFPKGALLPLPICGRVTVCPPQFFQGNAEEATKALEQTVARLEAAASAARHRRPAARRPPTVAVAVLGTDGCGKSTLSRSLAVEFSTGGLTCLVSDSLELFSEGASLKLQPLSGERLRVWLGRKAKCASSLKNYKIPKLAELMLRDRLLGEAEKWYAPHMLALDGMPLLNLIAWAGIYRPEHFNRDACSRAIGLLSRKIAGISRRDPLFLGFPELIHLRRLRLTNMHFPDVVVLLGASSQTCLARIESRGVRRQPHENKSDLDRLRQAYILVCDVLEQEWGVPVARFDSEAGTEVVAEQARAFISAFLVNNEHR